MKDGKQPNDELRNILKQQTMKSSKEARDKSLHAFEEGLKDVIESQQKEQKRKKLRQRLIGSVATVAAAGIAGLLILNSTFLQGDSLVNDANTGVGGGENGELPYAEENEVLIERVLDRPSFDHDDFNAMGSYNIYNDKLSVRLPTTWSVEEEEGEVAHSVYMNGPETERMEFILLNEGISEAQLEEKIREITTEFSEKESVTIPVETIIDEVRMKIAILFPFDNVFPFNIENTEVSAIIDEENGRFKELYVSELFGQPMVFIADLPLDHLESWTLPWIFFSYMRVVDTPYTIHGSEGEQHPEYDRPKEKNVILPVGASRFEEVDVELYEIEELGITSYLPSDTEVERIEHEYFTEWRFTEPFVSEKSFYSFGKLMDGFPLDEGKEIMFNAFNIDVAYHEDLGGGIPHHYSYYSGMEGEFIDGYIQLFEISGEWFYKHKHADREDYNGGVYIQRLQMFIDSLKIH
ncbi:hypothetical protein LGQ02_09965 [Bacillus shivajii]|uniref:hypothetical protein n=1 Tax=Bacillus shivajii TaxID=1983719 RepID=UPI001CF98401|nr:hypothetical protein [Bacillus shivajii]UCZ55018.1 hypothetical protein LGQ02_09965 [Bacillus shivajii]